MRRDIKLKVYIACIVAFLCICAGCTGKRMKNDDTVITRFPQIFEGEERFILQAHRGLCDEYPENTILSFEEAGKSACYQAIETDVQMTSDGVFVCMHDNSLERTTDTTGTVADYTYDELMEFWIDGGYGWDDKYDKQLKIPTIREYLDICRTYNKIPYIELKAIDDDGMKQLLEVLSEEGFEGKCVFTSFKLKYVKRMAELTSSYPIEYMTKESNKKTTAQILDDIDGIENVIYRPGAYMIDDKLIEECKKRDIPVEAYGLNVADSETVQKLIGYGVIGVTCNSYKDLDLR